MKNIISMIAGCVACVLATAGAANADTIFHYTFDAGSEYNVVGFSGYDYSVSGAFDYNATTQTANVTTGIYFDDAGHFTLSNVAVNSPTELLFSDLFGNQATLDFANSLALGGTDPISGGVAPGFTIAVAGSVTAATGAVPEPITLSLFGAGIVGAAAMRRRKKV